MKVIGRARFGADQEGANQFAKLMGHFGQTTNALSFVFSLFGFSFVVRTLGLKKTLRVFPFLLLFVVSFSAILPNLTVLFYSISLLKALTYSLNEPAMELLYMPTTEKIKFKAKAWIDVVGARSMKALGSAITHSAKDNPALLVRYGSVPTLLVSLALFGISILAGRRFEDLKTSGKIVGEDEEGSNNDDDDNEPSSSFLSHYWYDDSDDDEEDGIRLSSKRNRSASDQLTTTTPAPPPQFLHLMAVLLHQNHQLVGNLP
jgi:AAA family ATP:ADP antiporter